MTNEPINRRRGPVVAGFSLGWLFGLAGSFVGAGTSQDLLYAVSSIGLTTACVLLAVSLVGSHPAMAAGLLLLAIGEAVIHTQGPGGEAAFAAGTYSYLPALALAAWSDWGPTWTRPTAGVAAALFGIHAFMYAAGSDVSLSGPIAGAGYGFLSLTLIGWSIHLMRSRQVTELAASS